MPALGKAVARGSPVPPTKEQICDASSLACNPANFRALTRSLSGRATAAPYYK